MSAAGACVRERLQRPNWMLVCRQLYVLGSHSACFWRHILTSRLFFGSLHHRRSSVCSCTFNGAWQNATVATGTFNGLTFAASADTYDNYFTVTYSHGAFQHRLGSSCPCLLLAAAAAAAAAAASRLRSKFFLFACSFLQPGSPARRISTSRPDASTTWGSSAPHLGALRLAQPLVVRVRARATSTAGGASLCLSAASCAVLPVLLPMRPHRRRRRSCPGLSQVCFVVRLRCASVPDHHRDQRHLYGDVRLRMCAAGGVAPLCTTSPPLSVPSRHERSCAFVSAYAAC
jgi:hypothetical protein